MIKDLHIRDISLQDLPFLKRMLYESIYIPDGMSPLPESVIESPELLKYHAGWGRKGDMGLVVLFNNTMVGCIWLRLFKKPDTGYGYINDSIPELGMAVLPEYRGKGIGSKLLNVLLIKASEYGYNAISLSVNKHNKAINLYKRTGFVIYCEEDNAFTMVKHLKDN